MLKGKKVLLAITGSIAAYKACDVIRTLQKKEAQVKCIVTKAGLQFITQQTLEALLQSHVYTELFGEHPEKKAIHIYLAEWADIVAVVPTSADCIAKLAAGIADDLLSSVVLATRAKIICAPAMHTNMWNNSATKENVSKILKYGVHLVGPEEGPLSDGKKGVGHISPVEKIVDNINALLA